MTKVTSLSLLWQNNFAIEEIYYKINKAKGRGLTSIYEDCYSKAGRVAIKKHFELSDYEVSTYWVLGTVIIKW